MTDLAEVSQKPSEQTSAEYYDEFWRNYCETHISRLEQWKIRNGLSTGKVAVLLGLSPRTVANWLARKSAPVSTPTWKKLVVISRLPLLMLTLAVAADCVNADTPVHASFNKILKTPIHKHGYEYPFSIVVKKH
jgi:transcriptional regulator with XRE-family HTH domain